MLIKNERVKLLFTSTIIFPYTILKLAKSLYERQDRVVKTSIKYQRPFKSDSLLKALPCLSK